MIRRIPTPRRAAALALLVLGLGLGAGAARADFDNHPRLVAADRDTYAAWTQLRAATDRGLGFGGHRRRAMQLLQAVRRQMRMAASFADHR